MANIHNIMKNAPKRKEQSCTEKISWVMEWEMCYFRMNGGVCLSDEWIFEQKCPESKGVAESLI